MTSKLITLSADGATATVAPATLTDALSSIFSTTTFVSGGYGLLAKGLTVAGGMLIETKTGLMGNLLGKFGS